MMTQESPSIPGVGRKQAKYVLGRSSTESKRLSDQHEVLLKAAGGYIPVPLSIESEMLEAILDVGTGNGAWLVGLRQSGILPTSVELCGVDVSDKMMPSKELGRKFGLDLRVRDLSDPLPSTWNGKFDYIHGRHVFIWIEPYKWLNVMCNLKRTLKPGGTLVIIYPGEVPYDHQTEKPLGIDTAPKKLFSAFLQHTASAGLPRQAVASLPKLLVEAGFDSDSILSTTKRVNLGSAEPDPALRPASDHHLDFLLELMFNLNASPEDGFPSSDDHAGKSN
ncbi:hypothetical protein MJO29_007676 [Puccinia striiformis f. sp. tritici]|nr:hypothetical protein MJO29_007676 [Puccinia striiformis f. sp. tritici]